MSNAAQTIAILGGLVIVVGIVVSLQTFWIARSLDKVDAALGKLDAKIDTGLARLDTRLDELKTEIVRDHGERIARLEALNR
jgi:hypothetical protein